VSGILKGFDQLLNVVLDDAVEYLRGEACDPVVVAPHVPSRPLGLAAGGMYDSHVRHNRSRMLEMCTQAQLLRTDLCFNSAPPF